MKYTGYTKDVRTRLMEFAAIMRSSDIAELITTAVHELDKLQSDSTWHKYPDEKPEHYARVFVSCKGKSGKEYTTVARYIAPKSTKEEDYMSDDYEEDGSACEYDEENDCYWVKENFFEEMETAEYSYTIAEEVLSWRPLPRNSDVL